MAKAALGVRHRQRERAPGGAGIVVLPRERFDRLAVRGHARRDTEPDGTARWKPDTLAEADDRIEHDPGGSRERASVERQRIAGGSAAAQEAGAIGVPFERPLRSAP